MSKRNGGLFKFMAGIGLGVGAGMLLAPKKGEELRKDLKKKLDELVEKVKGIDKKELVAEIQDKIVASLPSTELYRKNYASPMWAPTLTGFLILITLILMVVIFIRLIFRVLRYHLII